MIAGTATVDLASGRISGDAHAVANDNFESHSLRFVGLLQEGITITVDPSTPADLRFATFHGHVHAVGNEVGLASATGIYSLDVNGRRAAVEMKQGNAWNPLVVPDSFITLAPAANGYDIDIRLDLPQSSNDVLIESQLEGTAFALARFSLATGTVLPAFADVFALDTAAITLTLPAGATYTSSSGVFLTAAVPEPASWLSLLAGLGTVGTIARRRRKRR